MRSLLLLSGSRVRSPYHLARQPFILMSGALLRWGFVLA